MHRAAWLLPCLMLALAPILAPRANAADTPVDPLTRFKNLPPGWSVVQEVNLPEPQLAAAGRRLGGQLVRLANATLAVDGQRIQVNTVVCKTADDAAKVHEAILRTHKGVHARCPREDLVVTEFAGRDVTLLERAYAELKFKRPKVTYDVAFSAAPLVKCDWMVWNRMFNAFLAEQPNEALVRELASKFTFTEQLRLRTYGVGCEPSVFKFEHKPQRTMAESDGELTTYAFAMLPRMFGVPQLPVQGVVTAEAFALTPSKRTGDKTLVAPNEFWPSDDPEIATLARQIVGEKVEPSERAAAILAWCGAKTTIRYGGQVTGSRYGVKAVLRQGFGHCWDFSDCFVTLCRACGVPCRQVLGWLHGESGHVWAEVLIEGKGWRQVDPTSGLGCDCRYVPLVATESGVMPFVYTSAVRITSRATASPR